MDTIRSVSSPPFIGCNISIVSNAQLRYEGILIKVDPDEYTITLARVRCYGAEGRKADPKVKILDPRKYDYVVFLGQHILSIDKIEYLTETVDRLTDPAIVNHRTHQSPREAAVPGQPIPVVTSSQRAVPSGPGNNVPGNGRISRPPPSNSAPPLPPPPPASFNGYPDPGVSHSFPPTDTLGYNNMPPYHRNIPPPNFYSGSRHPPPPSGSFYPPPPPSPLFSYPPPPHSNIPPFYNQYPLPHRLPSSSITPLIDPLDSRPHPHQPVSSYYNRGYGAGAGYLGAAVGENRSGGPFNQQQRRRGTPQRKDSSANTGYKPDEKSGSVIPFASARTKSTVSFSAPIHSSREKAETASKPASQSSIQSKATKTTPSSATSTAAVSEPQISNKSRSSAAGSLAGPHISSRRNSSASSIKTSSTSSLQGKERKSKALATWDFYGRSRETFKGFDDGNPFRYKQFKHTNNPLPPPPPQPFQRLTYRHDFNFERSNEQFEKIRQRIDRGNHNNNFSVVSDTSKVTDDGKKQCIDSGSPLSPTRSSTAPTPVTSSRSPLTPESIPLPQNTADTSTVYSRTLEQRRAQPSLHNQDEPLKEKVVDTSEEEDEDDVDENKENINTALGTDDDKASESDGSEISEASTITPKPCYYDKSLSFFDNISHVRSDDLSIRRDWKTEHDLNCETFGVNTVNFIEQKYRGRDVPASSSALRSRGSRSGARTVARGLNASVADYRGGRCLTPERTFYPTAFDPNQTFPFVTGGPSISSRSRGHGAPLPHNRGVVYTRSGPAVRRGFLQRGGVFSRGGRLPASMLYSSSLMARGHGTAATRGRGNVLTITATRGRRGRSSHGARV